MRDLDDRVHVSKEPLQILNKEPIRINDYLFPTLICHFILSCAPTGKENLRLNGYFKTKPKYCRIIGQNGSTGIYFNVSLFSVNYERDFPPRKSDIVFTRP